MGYSPVYAEFMVPRLPDTEMQLDFYDAIKWRRLEISEAPGDTFICPAPLPDGAVLPIYSYWQTENLDKLSRFEGYRLEAPSHFALGNRLLDLQQIVEVTLGVQTNDAVHRIFEAGGDILQKHAGAVLFGGGRPREECGRQILSFADPFNYMISFAAPRPDEFASPTSGDPIQVTVNLPFISENRELNKKTLTRLERFYDAIGFGVMHAQTGIPETYICSDGNFGDYQPIVTYRMTDEKSIANLYESNGEIHGSKFYEGLGFMAMYDMVEICLILPDNDAVQNSFDNAVRHGKIGGTHALEKHTHILPREHAGRLEYRFTDPFNIAIRVTSPSALVESVTQNFQAWFV